MKGLVATCEIQWHPDPGFGPLFGLGVRLYSGSVQHLKVTARVKENETLVPSKEGVIQARYLRAGMKSALELESQVRIYYFIPAEKLVSSVAVLGIIYCVYTLRDQFNSHRMVDRGDWR